MSRRLIFAPCVAAAAALGTGLWLSGLAWPIATQAWSVLAPRPDTDETEADLIG